eukprot:301161-Chlamydomonas_euryale.AAC.1
MRDATGAAVAAAAARPQGCVRLGLGSRLPSVQFFGQREVAARLRAANRTRGLVIRSRRLLRRVVRAQPAARADRRVANLCCPLAPRTLPNAAVCLDLALDLDAKPDASRSLRAHMRRLCVYAMRRATGARVGAAGTERSPLQDAEATRTSAFRPPAARSAGRGADGAGRPGVQQHRQAAAQQHRQAAAQQHRQAAAQRAVGAQAGGCMA